MILAIIVMILIFGVLVFVHELGHFVAARRSGVEVEEFGFGFPPRVVGKKVGRTIYSLNAIPLGGFVRLKGEDSADRSPGSFGAAAYRKKAKILLAGVGMNLIVAYLLVVVLAATGLPQDIAASLTSATPTERSATQVVIGAVVADSPAAKAGFTSGDHIVRFTGATSIASAADLTAYTKQHAGQTVRVEYTHRGQAKAVTLTLRDAQAGKKQGYLGVSSYETQQVRYGARSPLVAVEMTARLGWNTATGFIVGVPKALLTAGQLATGNKQADVSSVTVSGPVGIVALLQNLFNLDPSYLLFFIANISVSLAVVNVLPLPALDGGRLFLLTVQRLSRKQLSADSEALIHTLGFIALISLMVVLTVLDSVRIFSR